MPLHRLTMPQADEVLALAGAARDHDGVDPLNEEARFALRDESGVHFRRHRGDQLAGYLFWQPKHRTGQLVVAPRFRRQGIGSELLRGFVGWVPEPADWGIWAFGSLPAAQGFASVHGLSPVRGLLIMERDLTDFTAVAAPEGLTLRGYQAGDAADVLAVNAEAFAHHPEQGGLDATGLAARMAEPWFDPAGLILGFDADGLAGFHWTKRVDARTGEVYVMAVAPRAQGRGYGRALLQAGLTHLHRAGIGRVELYVDMADQVAVRMYESAGFRVTHRDLLLAPTPQEQP